jgi:hypothetical protein
MIVGIPKATAVLFRKCRRVNFMGVESADKRPRLGRRAKVFLQKEKVRVSA